MSDTEENKTGKVVELRGPDNFTIWKRAIRASLAAKNLNPYVTKEPSDIITEILQRYPVSVPPLPIEISKRMEATNKCEDKQAQAFGVLYNSLSTVVQNGIPEMWINWDNPQPKGLFEFLEKEYGASSGTRRAKLWRMS